MSSTIVNVAGHAPVSITNIRLSTKTEVINYLSETFTELGNMEHSVTTNETGDTIHTFSMVDGTKN